jgi:hypothetical protein
MVCNGFKPRYSGLNATLYASKRQFGLQLNYKACNGLFCWCRAWESNHLSLFRI